MDVLMVFSNDSGLVLGGMLDLAFNAEFSFPPAPPMHVMRYLLAGAVFTPRVWRVWMYGMTAPGTVW